MSAATRFVLILTALSIPFDRANAQAPLEAVPGSSLLAPAPHRSAPPGGGVEGFDAEPCCSLRDDPGEAPAAKTVVLSATATGIFFGAIVGGIYGSSRESCTECDFWGAVSGGLVGGLVGLAAGIALSIW